MAADLDLPLCDRARERGQGFAVEVALFRAARSLLDKLTTVDLARAA